MLNILNATLNVFKLAWPFKTVPPVDLPFSPKLTQSPEKHYYGPIYTGNNAHEYEFTIVFII
jgi:hypothetical protein